MADPRPSFIRRLGPYAHRYLPRTLRARLSLGIMLMSLALVLGAFGFTYLVVQRASADPTSVRVMLLSTADAPMNAALAAGLTAALAAGLIGASLGAALAHAFRTPIDRLSGHVREAGPLALEGRGFERLDVRVENTAEFIELGDTIDDLLESLSTKHAALKSAMAQARSAEESLRLVLDRSPEGMTLIEEGQVVYANSMLGQLMRVDVDAIIGDRFSTVFQSLPVTTEDGHSIPWERALEGARDGVLGRFEWADGGIAWLYIQAIPLADHGTDRWLVTARDITEERRQEELREEVFSLVTHDLRAPLTVIQGYLDILERPLSKEARSRALESARHNAQKMAGLLEDLLEATRAEQLLAPKVLQPVSLTTLAEEVCTSLGTTELRHQVRVVKEAQPWVLGEERRLRQALVNLVTNAFKYTPDDTTVTIRVSANATHGLLAVEDEGPGIPAEEREAVFARYRRLEDAAEKQQGLGLGLYIVHVIAEGHGGTALVEDAPAGGARFVISLPLQTAENA